MGLFDGYGLAVRLQGWNEYDPILLSPYFGNLVENLALSEISRFFINRGQSQEIFFVRSKDQVEVDFLVPLSNQRYIAIEVKVTPCDITKQQLQLLDSLKLNIIEKWVVTPTKSTNFAHAKVIPLDQIFEALDKLS